jgi:alkanesulfonate monooxygenase SsuD/methylene tetrahydromethanopterin reductase-like flavin-dependent oxidoreductase (luciferase family)
MAKAEQRSPSLQPRYRAFHATTACSAPELRVGTLALAVGAACGFSLHARQRLGAEFLGSAPAIILAAAAVRTNTIRLTSAVTVLSAVDPEPVFHTGFTF